LAKNAYRSPRRCSSPALLGGHSIYYIFNQLFLQKESQPDFMAAKLLGPTGKQWLKSIHLTLSVIWLGGAICMHVLRWAWRPSGSGDLYAVDHTIVLLDHWIMIPSSLGALLTGLLESWLTTWGFFKYRWVTLKWIATAAIMLYGPFFQAQWAKKMVAISQMDGLLALQNPVYLQYRLLYTVSGVVMITLLAILPIISVLKPWTRQDRINSNQRVARTSPSAETND
jgi:hypothetical protein